MPHQPNAADPPADHLRLIVDADDAPVLDGPASAGEFDALADLFLDGDTERSPASPHTTTQAARPAPGTSRRRPLEVVIGANLPRPAGGWLVAFARSRAEILNAATLLARSDDGLCSIQRVDAPDRGASEPGLDLLTVSSAEDIPVDTRIQRVTVLAGAGETGAVAAYAAMKSLAPFLLADRTPRPHLGLCIVGASRERALESHGALRRAAESFLSLRVEFSGAILHPDHGGAETIWRAADADLSQLLQALDRPTHAPAPSRPATTVPTAASAPTTRPITSPPAAAGRAIEPTSSPPADIALSAVCPEAPTVRFRVTRDGVLHLHTDDLEQSTAEAAAALLAAGAWASRHGETLRALVRAMGGPALTDSPSVSHLTTRDARRARPLLDTSIRLEVVATPKRPGEPVRVALN